MKRMVLVQPSRRRSGAVKRRDSAPSSTQAFTVHLFTQLVGVLEDKMYVLLKPISPARRNPFQLYIFVDSGTPKICSLLQTQLEPPAFLDLILELLKASRLAKERLSPQGSLSH